MKSCPLLSDQSMPPLALLAGGMATRLGAIAMHQPKSLIQVAGEPFIAHQLRKLSAENIHDVVLCCGHFGDRIADFVGEGTQFGCRVQYSFDGEALLGTGGAIVKALSLLGSHFWVLYGDSYLTAPFAPALRAFEESGCDALMTILRNDGQWDKSNIEFTNGRLMRYSKQQPTISMRHIDYGLGIYRSGTFSGFSQGQAFDLSVLQGSLVQRGAVTGFEVSERFYEIGSVNGLAEADAFLRRQEQAGVYA